ncbi:MAG TPA: IPT/TIG domain-containing protein [Thermoleophilaceae bacterium]|nr:IPT/TIG domain-containing protein [Thermoleophilaceae bacterium]
MLRLPVLTALVACGALLAPVGVAEAAKKSTKPAIKRVTPMRATVGKTLTIRGTNFSKSRRRNTVLFIAGKRQAFAKPRRASRKKLVVKIPGSVENLLDKAKRRGATRLKLRVVTKRYGKKTTLRLSPIVLSARGVVAACSGSDADNDLLSKDVELKYALDPCKKDTDGDGSEDGWEFWSAKDLNRRSVPYPGKKPYPNPLDSADTGVDFDGDWLTSKEEFNAWVSSGRNFDQSRPGSQSPLGYSDGAQFSYPDDPMPMPAWKSPSYNIGFIPPNYPAILQEDGDPRLSDNERDADHDGLNNVLEAHGEGTASWWSAKLAKEDVEPWPGADPYVEYYYWGDFSRRPFANVNLADPDVDGDSLLDGEDDQDNDDWTNLDEMLNRSIDTPAGVRNTNPFNPCAPDTRSRTCPLYFPL